MVTFYANIQKPKPISVPSIASDTIALYFDDNWCSTELVDGTGDHDLTAVGSGLIYDGNDSPPVGTKSVRNFADGRYLTNTTINSVLASTPNNWTIEAYVLMVGTSNKCLVSTANVGDTIWTYIGTDSGNTRLRTHWSTNIALNGVANVGTTWKHVAYTWNGTLLKYYIDNVEDLSTASANRSWLDIPTFNIGNWISSNLFWNGGINQLRLSNITRTTFPTVDNN